MASDDEESPGMDTMSQLHGMVRYIAELESRLDETESRLGDEARAHAAARRAADNALAERLQLEADVNVHKEACNSLETALLSLQNEASPRLDHTIRPADLAVQQSSQDLQSGIAAAVPVPDDGMSAAHREAASPDFWGSQPYSEQQSFAVVRAMLEAESNAHAGTRAALQDALCKLEANAAPDDPEMQEECRRLRVMLESEEKAQLATQAKIREVCLKSEAGQTPDQDLMSSSMEAAETFARYQADAYAKLQAGDAAYAADLSPSTLQAGDAARESYATPQAALLSSPAAQASSSSSGGIGNSKNQATSPSRDAMQSYAKVQAALMDAMRIHEGVASVDDSTRLVGMHADSAPWDDLLGKTRSLVGAFLELNGQQLPAEGRPQDDSKEAAVEAPSGAQQQARPVQREERPPTPEHVRKAQEARRGRPGAAQAYESCLEREAECSVRHLKADREAEHMRLQALDATARAQKDKIDHLAANSTREWEEASRMVAVLQADSGNQHLSFEENERLRLQAIEAIMRAGHDDTVEVPPAGSSAYSPREILNTKCHLPLTIERLSANAVKITDLLVLGDESKTMRKHALDAVMNYSSDGVLGRLQAQAQELGKESDLQAKLDAHIVASAGTVPDTPSRFAMLPEMEARCKFLEELVEAVVADTQPVDALTTDLTRDQMQGLPSLEVVKAELFDMRGELGTLREEMARDPADLQVTQAPVLQKLAEKPLEKAVASTEQGGYVAEPSLSSTRVTAKSVPSPLASPRQLPAPSSQTMLYGNVPGSPPAAAALAAESLRTQLNAEKLAFSALSQGPLQKRTELEARLKFLEELCDNLQEKISEKPARAEAKLIDANDTAVLMENSRPFSPDQSEAHLALEVVQEELRKAHGARDHVLTDIEHNKRAQQSVEELEAMLDNVDLESLGAAGRDRELDELRYRCAVAEQAAKVQGLQGALESHTQLLNINRSLAHSEADVLQSHESLQRLRTFSNDSLQKRNDLRHLLTQDVSQISQVDSVLADVRLGDDAPKPMAALQSFLLAEIEDARRQHRDTEQVLATAEGNSNMLEKEISGQETTLVEIKARVSKLRGEVEERTESQVDKVDEAFAHANLQPSSSAVAADSECEAAQSAELVASRRQYEQAKDDMAAAETNRERLQKELLAQEASVHGKEAEVLKLKGEMEAHVEQALETEGDVLDAECSEREGLTTLSAELEAARRQSEQTREDLAAEVANCEAIQMKVLAEKACLNQRETQVPTIRSDLEARAQYQGQKIEQFLVDARVPDPSGGLEGALLAMSSELSDFRASSPQLSGFASEMNDAHTQLEQAKQVLASMESRCEAVHKDMLEQAACLGRHEGKIAMLQSVLEETQGQQQAKKHGSSNLESISYSRHEGMKKATMSFAEKHILRLDKGVLAECFTAWSGGVRTCRSTTGTLSAAEEAQRRQMLQRLKNNGIAFATKQAVKLDQALQSECFIAWVCWSHISKREAGAALPMSAEEKLRLKSASMAFANKHTKDAQASLQSEVFALWTRILLAAKAERAAVGEQHVETLRKLQGDMDAAHLASDEAAKRQQQDQRDRSMAFMSRHVLHAGKSACAECFKAWVCLACTKQRKLLSMAFASRQVETAVSSLLEGCFHHWMRALLETKIAHVTRRSSLGCDAAVTAQEEVRLAMEELKEQHANDLSDLRADLEKLQQKRAESKAELAQTQQELEEKKEKDLSDLHSDLEKLRQERDEAKAKLAQTQQDLEEKKEKDVNNLRADLEKLRQERNEAKAELDQTQQELEEKKEKALIDLQADLEKLRQERDEAKAELAHTQQELEEKKEKDLSDLQADLEMLRQEGDEAKAKLAQTQQELEERKEKDVSDLRADLEKLRQECDEAKSELDQTQQELEEKKEKEKDHLEQLKMAKEYQEHAETSAGERQQALNGLKGKNEALLRCTYFMEQRTQHSSEVAAMRARYEEKREAMSNAEKLRTSAGESDVEAYQSDLDRCSQEVELAREECNRLAGMLTVADQQLEHFLQELFNMEDLSAFAKELDEFRRQLASAELQREEKALLLQEALAAATQSENNAQVLKEDSSKAQSELANVTEELDEAKHRLNQLQQSSEAELEASQTERDELMAKLRALEDRSADLDSKLQGASQAAEEDSAANLALEKKSSELTEALAKATQERDENATDLQALDQRCQEMRSASKVGGLELESARQESGLNQQKVAELAASLEEREAASNKMSTDLDALRRQNAEIQAFTEERCTEWQVCQTKNREEFQRLMTELQETRSQRDELKRLLEAAEKTCQEMKAMLKEREETHTLEHSAAQKALMKKTEESENTQNELQAQLAEMSQRAQEIGHALTAEAKQKQIMMEWVKIQRGGLAGRFEHTLNSLLQARVFDALKRWMLTVRFNRLGQEVKQRVQAAAESAAEDNRRTARAQEEADTAAAEADRLRRLVVQLQARLAEVEKLKEVDIKLEVMARERKLRDLIDQRAESLPLMPDSPHGMMPSPPHGDSLPPWMPAGHGLPGSGRNLQRGASDSQSRPMSTGTRLPPTNHFGRAAEAFRAEGTDIITGIRAPVRAHTSMDHQQRAHTSMDHQQYAHTVSHLSEHCHSRSPERSQQSPRHAGHPLPIAPRSARQNPRGQRGNGRRGPGTSLPNRRHGNPGDAASDMWAFVNFGTPMTDCVMNAEPPMPKQLRKLVGREGDYPN